MIKRDLIDIYNDIMMTRCCNCQFVGICDDLQRNAQDTMCNIVIENICKGIEKN